MPYYDVGDRLECHQHAAKLPTFFLSVTSWSPTSLSTLNPREKYIHLAAMASDTKHLLGRGNKFQSIGGVMMRRSTLNDGQMFGQDYDQFKSNLN